MYWLQHSIDDDNDNDDDLETSDAKNNKKTYLSWSISLTPLPSSILPAVQISYLHIVFWKKKYDIFGGQNNGPVGLDI